MADLDVPAAAKPIIYDLGLHRGEDTEFYLKKGFRVVAIEANSRLCEEVATRLAPAVADGSLTIVNRAIAAEPGSITFYENAHSIWSTVDPAWAERNERLGHKSVARTVVATTVSHLIEEFGVPYYAKIDIEGMDLVALRGFRGSSQRPKYVSIESDKVSFRELRHEFDTFTELGYDRFKLVPQRNVAQQRLPKPALEGDYVDFTFKRGSSGAFGEEAPGHWVTAEQALDAYKSIFLRYALTGDDPFVRNKLVRTALKALGFRSNWYDTHARLAGS